MTNKNVLEGVKVIAMEQYIAAPYCTMLMADAGAEVIKIERPGAGDPRRGMSPIFTDDQGNKVSSGFIEYNRHKKSLTLNIQEEQGKKILLDLIKQADILINNFRPGVMDRLGLGYQELQKINPGLVYVAISGFGQMEGYRGPYWDRPAFDIVAEAMSGYMHMIGHTDEPPQTSIYGLADLLTSWAAYSGAMTALFDRMRTGKGRFVDISMYDAMVALNERALMIYSFTGEVPIRGPEKLYGPRGSFKAKNGYIVLNVPSDYMWERLATAIGQEELINDERFKDGISRAANTEKHFRPLIEKWLSDKTKEEAVQIFLKNGLPAGEVQTAEDIAGCPHLKARQLLVEVEHPVTGKKQVVGSPLFYSDAPARETAGVPELGQHTEQILKKLGRSEQEIKALRENKVI